jgi:hypothetical protein
MVYDPGAPRAYTREEFQQLYNKAKHLERELGGANGLPLRPENARPSQSEQFAPETATRHDSSTNLTQTASKPGHYGKAPIENRFVGQDTAVGFFLSRLHPSRRQGTATTQSEQPELRAPRMPYHAPHPFPPRDTAMIAVRD